MPPEEVVITPKGKIFTVGEKLLNHLVDVAIMTFKESSIASKQDTVGKHFPVVLLGPPGIGKTMLMKQLVDEINAIIYNEAERVVKAENKDRDGQFKNTKLLQYLNGNVLGFGKANITADDVYDRFDIFKTKKIVKLYTIVLSHFTPEQLSGYLISYKPTKTEAIKVMLKRPMEILPDRDDEYAIIFLDELTTIETESMLAVALKLLDERRSGSSQFIHSFITGAGNTIEVIGGGTATRFFDLRHFTRTTVMEVRASKHDVYQYLNKTYGHLFIKEPSATLSYISLIDTISGHPPKAPDGLNITEGLDALELQKELNLPTPRGWEKIVIFEGYYGFPPDNRNHWQEFVTGTVGKKEASLFISNVGKILKRRRDAVKGIMSAEEIVETKKIGEK